MVRLLIAGVGILAFTPMGFAQPAGGRLWVYIGTYTGKQSKGIYRAELDLKTGKLSEPVLAAEVPNPSFLAIHPTGRFLYAVSEVGGGKKAGSVHAFALSPKTGALAHLNEQSSGGAGPCHVTVDPTGKVVLAANYGAGSACSLPVGPDGKLGAPASVVQHRGTSVNKQRQEAPHAHSVNVDRAGRFAFVADLGLDKVMIYRLDPKDATLTPNEPAFVALEPGAGPRHFAFHPDGAAAYVINELDSTLTTMDYDPKAGALKPRQTVSTLPMPVKGNSTAEVVVHPSGRFVYGSNRGHDSIAVFAVDPKTHELRPAGHQRQHIKTPRNFAIDPTGTYLLVGNQGANTIAVFRIDPQTGALTSVGDPVAVPSPVCIRFLPVGRD